MVLFQSLFNAFIDIVLLVVNKAYWLCIPLLVAFTLAFVAVLAYKIITELGVTGRC